VRWCNCVHALLAATCLALLPRCVASDTSTAQRVYLPAIVRPVAVSFWNYAAYPYINPGDYEILGEVRNDGATPLYNVRVRADLYNPQAQLAGTATGGTSLIVLLPGEKAAFSCLAASVPGWRYFTLSASTGPPPPPLPKVTYSHQFSFQSVSASWTPGKDGALGTYRLTGLVCNRTTEQWGSIHVIVTLYDADGVVTYVFEPWPIPSTLLPNQLASFSLATSTKGPAEVTSYSLVAEGFN
jgi:hypothetical protein